MSSTPSNIDAIAAADDLPLRLASGLSAGVSARNSARCFAPELSYGRHFGPAPATAKQAAVVALLYRRGGRWHVPLTERPATLVRHGGQISLPGGSVEPGESSEQAAFRELDEELGVDTPVELLGRLGQCYVYASDYVITPWVAATNGEPAWRPHAEEVTRVIELPLAAMLDEQSVGVMTVQRGPVVFRAPCYRIGEHSIWGATSIVLGELAGVLRRLAAATS